MASTAIHNVITRPQSAPVGPQRAIFSTNMSTSSTATSRTMVFGTAVNQISAQTLFTSTAATATLTLSFDGSLFPTAGWTAIKSTTWTSTQGSAVRSILPPSSRCYTHLRVRVTDMSTQPAAGLADAQVWVAAR